MITRFAAYVALTVFIFASGARADNIVVKEIGSFYIGGQEMRITGQPMIEVSTTAGAPPRKRDPNGEFYMGQMYVQYINLAEPKAKYPILLIHGGGLSGATWENSPDGHPGWELYFLNAGYDVYEPDAVERGRSTWSQFYEGKPMFRPKGEAWELFRFGPVGSYNVDPAKRTAYPGVQFPVDKLDDFAKQLTPRWSTTDALTQRAYDELVERVCPCAIVVHSQGGNFGYNMVLHNPNKIKALVLLEPTGAPDPATADKSASAKTPQLAIWGDNIEGDKIWMPNRQASASWRDAVKSAGGTFDWIELPKLGIAGNTHMMMMDRNSDQVADIVQNWLKGHGSMK
jgi:pimeloyl-ACP methyl ester carboxylesterase